MDQFLTELKRRNVIRVGIAYTVTAWLILQVGELLSSIGILPEWLPRILFIILAIGFVASLILAWVYEVTEKGIQRESELDHSANRIAIDRRKLDFMIMGLLAVALAYMLLDKFVFEFPAGDVVDRERSIAVLPFANRSELDSDLHFVDGIHDDILTQLANLTGLDKVISRTSVERFRETAMSTPEIGQSLGVAHVLEGGVQRAGDRIRINMQLIDTHTDEHLWAETYNREMTVENLFAIQSEIVREVVSSLHGVLNAKDNQKLDRVPTTSLEAYGEYVLGRQAMARRRVDELEKAIMHFEKAIELDPDYALPYAHLADSIQIRAFQAREDIEVHFERRQALIDRALELDPISGEAWTALALLRTNQVQTGEAVRYYEKALELSPNYATAWQWYSHLFNRPEYENRDKALTLIRKAIDLDPMAGILQINLVDTLERLGRWEEVFEVLNQGVARDPEFLMFYVYLNFQHAGHGRLAEALRWARAGLGLSPDHRGLRIDECHLLLHLADDVAAEGCYDRLGEDFPDESWHKHRLFYYRGEWDEKVAYLEGLAGKQRPRWLPFLLIWSYMDVGNFDRAFKLSRERRRHMYLDEPHKLEDYELAEGAEVATLLLNSGDKEGADRYFDQILEITNHGSRLGRQGYGWWDIGVHIQRGDKQAAVTALREAIDSGLRADWWLFNTPYLVKPMKDVPEWHALWSELRADIDRQRAWYEANKDDSLP